MFIVILMPKVNSKIVFSEIPVPIQKYAISNYKEGMSSVAAGFHSEQELYLTPFA